MIAETLDLILYIRRFDHIIGDKGGQGLHAQELVRLMKMQVDPIHALTFKELVRIVKCF